MIRLQIQKPVIFCLLCALILNSMLAVSATFPDLYAGNIPSVVNDVSVDKVVVIYKLNFRGDVISTTTYTDTTEANQVLEIIDSMKSSPIPVSYHAAGVSPICVTVSAGSKVQTYYFYPQQYATQSIGEDRFWYGTDIETFPLLESLIEQP